MLGLVLDETNMSSIFLLRLYAVIMTWPSHMKRCVSSGVNNSNKL